MPPLRHKILRRNDPVLHRQAVELAQLGAHQDRVVFGQQGFRHNKGKTTHAGWRMARTSSCANVMAWSSLSAQSDGFIA